MIFPLFQSGYRGHRARFAPSVADRKSSLLSLHAPTSDFHESVTRFKIRCYEGVVDVHLLRGGAMDVLWAMRYVAEARDQAADRVSTAAVGEPTRPFGSGGWHGDPTRSLIPVER